MNLVKLCYMPVSPYYDHPYCVKSGIRPPHGEVPQTPSTDGRSGCRVDAFDHPALSCSFFDPEMVGQSLPSDQFSVVK